MRSTEEGVKDSSSILELAVALREGEAATGTRVSRIVAAEALFGVGSGGVALG